MGNPPVTTAYGVSNFDSSLLNENQIEVTHYGVLALQKSINGFDGQLAYFTRYNNLQFTPDVIGDMLLNGIASNPTPTASRATARTSSTPPIWFVPASRSAANRQR